MDHARENGLWQWCSTSPWAHLHHIGQDLHPISANCLHQWLQDPVRHLPWRHSYLFVYCASYILPFKTIILESTIRYQLVVALPFWHLLTASLALAETPTAGAADDLVNSSCSFTMPYVCSVGTGSHDSVEEYFHARLDILRYLMKFFNGGGRILAVKHEHQRVISMRLTLSTSKQSGHCGH